MDLDPSGVIQRPLRLPHSRWPEPMDVDPPRWPEPMELDYFEPEWPQPMDLDPSGFMVFTPLNLRFSP